ncbi:hypothetical protein [Nocardioides sp. zg-DK7169]|uniref:hypothetical protein n=1 Tax=Nocardioides sp. zg-DK7169 TaxID=2736600 RepID=UPI00155566C9|nr:hypothetical protein [Nocardioides sp. zg-DK7169]NPC96262.1 hypothetical protein [Nocardioides sp. zg-DK7169]
MPSRYAALSRDELAALVPELLLIGQLIDRSGMAWCIGAFGREQMAQIAIEEWAASSPIYTRRMQDALGYAPAPGEGDVVTIFKGLQLDIGAPPQFMDFRYTVHDRWNGEFHLDHCGALLDVEPMGPDYVRSMCHDIEDPTFDATAVATNPHAQVRPLHRPPRVPADRRPHCAWTVRIDPSHPPVAAIEQCAVIAESRAARLVLDPIDPADEGQADYTGPLVSDLDFAEFSHCALVRIADEVCVQMHLLNLAFVLAVRARAGADEGLLRTITTRQLTGIAGVAAARIHRALALPSDAAGALRVLELHPLLNPASYVDATLEPGTPGGPVLGGDPVLGELSVRESAATHDGAWISRCGPGSIAPLQAIVRAVDPHLDVEVVGTDEDWVARLIERAQPAPVADEVAVTRISGGAGFEFEPRRSLPITPVG